MNIKDFELTEEQLRAVKSLERALKKCAKAKVALFGKSSTLLAYNGIKYDEASEKGLVTFNLTTNCIPNETIKTYRSYRDSGADDEEYLIDEE